MTITLSRALLIVAVVCFALAILNNAGIVSLKADWTDFGLLFGFLSFLA